MTDKQKKLLESGIINTGLDLSIPEHEKLWIGGGKIFGGTSQIKYEIINESGDWGKYAQKDESQKPYAIDYMDCTSESTIESGGMQINRLIKAGELKIELLSPWLDESGLFNGSERANAIQAGNTPNGNNMQNPPEAVRKNGIIPEIMCSRPTKKTSWYQYHSQDSISKEAKAMGLKFLEYFTVQYEKLPRKFIMGWGDVSLERIKKELKQAPIIIATACCPGWFNDGVTVQACSSTPNHATCIQSVNDLIVDRDSYPNYIRHLASNYKIPYAYKMVITPNPIILKNSKEMPTNVKTVKCADGSAGFYLPANSPASFRSMAANFGLVVPGEAPSTVYWDEVEFDGEVTLKED